MSEISRPLNSWHQLDHRICYCPNPRRTPSGPSFSVPLCHYGESSFPFAFQVNASDVGDVTLGVHFPPLCHFQAPSLGILAPVTDSLTVLILDQLCELAHGSSVRLTW